MIRVLTNKMASAWANTTSTSGRIYGIQLVAGGVAACGEKIAIIMDYEASPMLKLVQPPL